MYKILIYTVQQQQSHQPSLGGQILNCNIKYKQKHAIRSAKAYKNHSSILGSRLQFLKFLQSANQCEK
jgi:hypothetical protein